MTWPFWVTKTPKDVADAAILQCSLSVTKHKMFLPGLRASKRWTTSKFPLVLLWLRNMKKLASSPTSHPLNVLTTTSPSMTVDHIARKKRALLALKSHHKRCAPLLSMTFLHQYRSDPELPPTEIESIPIRNTNGEPLLKLIELTEELKTR
ncbi:hypothetical protein PROFUN_05511 [Planoprotostelium fungivorum]|uniref:Uncharacterized protein n=1 Tax=Planoprotostelium fungivorum TaxID=1890364 RepID=A0A2P6NR09_9EUKA|nr:hypothetical protein PROFUN_05511 [Planoprotostelium fungivorum]